MKAKNKITFVFDDEADAWEVLQAIGRHNEISWSNDTRQAMIKADIKKMAVLVSKSIIVTPKPLRV